jgi:hypothetical protein
MIGFSEFHFTIHYRPGMVSSLSRLPISEKDDITSDQISTFPSLIGEISDLNYPTSSVETLCFLSDIPISTLQLSILQGN